MQSRHNLNVGEFYMLRDMGSVFLDCFVFAGNETKQIVFTLVHSVMMIIIKITISSIVIGLKNSYFSLIHLPSCYRTVCYRTACYRTVCYRTV